MSTLSGRLNVAELIRREDPNGRMAQIVDVLSKTNMIVADATAIECNNGTYHEDTRSVSEPAGAERAYDQGVAVESGVTEKVTEPTCMVDGLSEVDARKIDHQPDPMGARSQEDGFFMRGMTKTMVSRLFDGNRSTNPLQINGLNNRSDYNALSSDYVFDNAAGNCADASTFTSIYIIQWGPKMVNLIYPRNDSLASGSDDGNRSIAGVQMEDYGRQMITDANASTKKYPAYQTWFELHFGWFIHDPRCIKRICNIATSSINGTTYVSFDENVLIDAYNELEYGGEGAIIYCNRTVKAQMQKRANDKNNAMFTETMEGEGPFARPVLRFWGIPVHECAGITNTQADVT